MGRRKIEIKAIKDDRNRSVTFLKRKGGLFKKAHELSVLCSVDVAVIIFGNNKKLYQYSSCDMNNLISRYTYHGVANEHKGPADFNGGGDDDDDDDENGSPPQSEGLETHMLHPHYTGQPPFPQIRHHTPSASPPIQNGMFVPHPSHPIARGHTPQPQVGSRPSSRNDMRRMPPNMMPQPVGPPGPPQPPVNGFAYMPQPAIYQPPPSAPPMPTTMPPSGPPAQPGYPYAPPPQAHSQQLQPPYMDSQRRSSVPPNFPPLGPPGPVPAPRQSVSPPRSRPQQLPPQARTHMSPPPPHIHLPVQSSPQPRHASPPRVQEPPRQPPPSQEFHPPEPVEPKAVPQVKTEPPVERPRQALLLDTGVKKQKASIFTPVDEGRSILSQHLAAFHPEVKSDSAAGRPQPIEVGAKPAGTTSSPPPLQRPGAQAPNKRNDSVSSSAPDSAFTPPSRSNSLQTPGGSTAARPRLKVQIPDEPSDGGSATAESSSPRGGASTDTTSQHSSRRPTDSHSSGVVLPPPSPSASALLSAGAIGPPNPFARPPPAAHPNNNTLSTETPVSALPSRFLNSDFLPSPSSFYPEWNFRQGDSNMLQSPVNYTTPVAGNGPSFLREDANSHKRKSPETNGNGSTNEPGEHGNEPKRAKVEASN